MEMETIAMYLMMANGSLLVVRCILHVMKPNILIKNGSITKNTHLFLDSKKS
jgi:hypothetical protein